VILSGIGIDNVDWIYVVLRSLLVKEFFPHTL